MLLANAEVITGRAVNDESLLNASITVKSIRSLPDKCFPIYTRQEYTLKASKKQ